MEVYETQQPGFSAFKALKYFEHNIWLILNFFPLKSDILFIKIICEVMHAPSNISTCKTSNCLQTVQFKWFLRTSNRQIYLVSKLTNTSKNVKTPLSPSLKPVAAMINVRATKAVLWLQVMKEQENLSVWVFKVQKCTSHMFKKRNSAGEGRPGITSQVWMLRLRYLTQMQQHLNALKHDPEIPRRALTPRQILREYRGLWAFLLAR